MTVLLAVMVVGVVAVSVVWPLFRPGPQAAPDPIGPAARLAALQERKLQLYGAIRELGFDYRTDKLEEADYEEEVERVKAEAVAVVREIDELKRRPPRGPEALEAEIAAFRAQHAAPALGDVAPAAAAPGAPPGGAAKAFCTQCGAGAAPGDRFCGACGHALRSA